MEDTTPNKTPRMMPREMLKDLFDLVSLHKENYPDLYHYLALTWTACHYNSTLYTGNVTGMVMMQQHLRYFEKEYEDFLQKEVERGNI
jgi:hypothetical protein